MEQFFSTWAHSGEKPSSIQRKSVVDITVDYIVDQVNSRTWRPGTKIPTEFELMESLNVSRNSVREAIKVLESLGLLEIRRADGTYVADHFSEKMLNPWACSLMLEDDYSDSLLELRIMVEQGAFSLACEKGTEEEFAAIRAMSQRIETLAMDPDSTADQLIALDIAYRSALCHAAHNPLVERVNDMIAYATMRSRKQSIIDAIADEDRFHIAENHRMLTETVVNRRAEDLFGVLKYCFKHWSNALANEERVRKVKEAEE